MSRTVSSSRILTRDMGSALSFNGTNSIAVKTTETLYNLGTYTLAFWIRAGAQTAYNSVFMEGRSTDDIPIVGLRMGISSNDRKIVHYVRNNANTVTDETASNARVFDGAAHFIVFKEDNGSCTLKIDDVVDKTWSYTRSGTLTLDRSAIGALQRTSPIIFSKSIIDSVRAWSRITTDAEDTDLYLRGTVPTTGIVINLPMDEGSGTTLTDATSGATWTITSPTWVTGQFLRLRSAASNRPLLRSMGKSVLFDGVGDYATVPITPSTTAFSTMFWVRPNKAVASDRFIDWGAVGPDGGFNISVSSTGNYNALIYNTTSIVSSWFSSPNAAKVIVGDWAHLALSYEQNNANFYVNGTLITPPDSNVTMTTAAGQTLTLGRRSATATFPAGALMSDFIFVNSRAITATEVTNHMLYGARPTGTTAHYNFNDNLTDQTGNGNNGTLVTGAYSSTTPYKLRSSVA
jgi:hypothetical protein